MKLINKGPDQYCHHQVGKEFEVSEEEGRRILRDFLGSTRFHFIQSDYVPALQRPVDQTEKITVMIPVYNGEKYIAESVESILAQTYKNLEVIVCNDGSTDATLKILKVLAEKDKRLTVFSNKTNKGVGFSRSKLLARCPEGLAAWQDADDIAAPGRIERQMQAMADLRKRFPDKKFIVYCGWEFVDEGGTRDQDGNYHQFNCALFMRDASTPQVDETLRWAEDMKWHDDLINAGYSESHVDEVLQGYRQHENSLTKQRVREGKA
jgi:glycosyltransferase involved in cell wall biosynthesis